MNQRISLLTGIGVGAGLMYLFDPGLGRRRRALLRDQIVSAISRLDDCLSATQRDFRQWARGLAAEAPPAPAGPGIPVL